MTALNGAVTALGGNESRIPERGTHWCHDCKESVTAQEEYKCKFDFILNKGSKCQGLFIEEMDNSA